MNLQYAKDPRWSNADNSTIDLIIKWDGYPDELPFTADPADVEPYGREIYAAAQAGTYGPVAEYIPPQPSDEQQAEKRKLAYEQEADPLFFMSQRGEATTAEWEAKIVEIKARYPYQE